MERVLLLNATFEPLALVSDRRAVVLVLAGRAEPVAFREDCAVFHSASLNVDVPSIVRLAHMVRIPRWARTPPVTRRSVLRRDGGLCVYCSEPVSYTHLDVYKRQAWAGPAKHRRVVPRAPTWCVLRSGRGRRAWALLSGPLS